MSRTPVIQKRMQRHDPPCMQSTVSDRLVAYMRMECFAPRGGELYVHAYGGDRGAGEARMGARTCAVDCVLNGT